MSEQDSDGDDWQLLPTPLVKSHLMQKPSPTQAALANAFLDESSDDDWVDAADAVPIEGIQPKCVRLPVHVANTGDDEGKDELKKALIENEEMRMTILTLRKQLATLEAQLKAERQRVPANDKDAHSLWEKDGSPSKIAAWASSGMMPVSSYTAPSTGLTIIGVPPCVGGHIRELAALCRIL